MLCQYSSGFLLGFGKEMVKGCEEIGVVFLFPFCNSFLLLLSFSEEFDFS